MLNQYHLHLFFTPSCWQLSLAENNRIGGVDVYRFRPARHMHTASARRLRSGFISFSPVPVSHRLWTPTFVNGRCVEEHNIYTVWVVRDISGRFQLPGYRRRSRPCRPLVHCSSSCYGLRSTVSRFHGSFRLVSPSMVGTMARSSFQYPQL